jgi:hypothetical protein
MRRCRLLIGYYPTSSAPPRFRRNLPWSGRRGILGQAPTSAERKAEIERELKAYCALDKEAMIRIWDGRTETSLR